MADTGPILRVDNLLPVATCRALFDQYDAALTAGKATPRRGPSGQVLNPSDMPLRELAPHVQIKTCCGVPPLDLLALRDDLCKRVADRYGLAGLVADYSAYSRITKGGQHPLHADAVTLKGEPNHTPHRAATAIVYLSPASWEFCGGEISFPGMGLSVTPAPGLMIAFPSGLAFRHVVKRVTCGKRDALLFWFTQDPTKAEAWPTIPAPIAAATPEPAKTAH